MTGVAGLGWQVYTWLQDRRSRVTVSVCGAVVAYTSDPDHVVSIRVVNDHDHAIRVASIGFDMQNHLSQQVVIIRQMPATSLPGVVSAHDSGEGWMLQTDFEKAGLDIYTPVVAWARLATGEKVRSPLTQIMSRA
jgi:hypothetical protein